MSNLIFRNVQRVILFNDYDFYKRAEKLYSYLKEHTTDFSILQRKDVVFIEFTDIIPITITFEADRCVVYSVEECVESIYLWLLNVLDEPYREIMLR